MFKSKLDSGSVYQPWTGESKTMLSRLVRPLCLNDVDQYDQYIRLSNL